MNIRTTIALTTGAFALGFGMVAAFRLPDESLTMTVAMIITFLMVIIAMIAAGGIVGVVAVKIVQARAESGGGGGSQQPIYPPVMIFPGQNAPGQNYLPANGNGAVETMPGPRTFTVIGEGDDVE